MQKRHKLVHKNSPEGKICGLCSKCNGISGTPAMCVQWNPSWEWTRAWASTIVMTADITPRWPESEPATNVRLHDTQENQIIVLL